MSAVKKERPRRLAAEAADEVAETLPVRKPPHQLTKTSMTRTPVIRIPVTRKLVIRMQMPEIPAVRMLRMMPAARTPVIRMPAAKMETTTHPPMMLLQMRTQVTAIKHLLTMKVTMSR